MEEQESHRWSSRLRHSHMGSVRIGRVPFAHPCLPFVDSRSRIVVLVVQRFQIRHQVRFLTCFDYFTPLCSVIGWLIGWLVDR